MYKGEVKLQEKDLRVGVEYYAVQGTAIVDRIVYGPRVKLPQNADYYDVRTTVKSVRNRIGVKARSMMLVDEDVVWAKWKDAEGVEKSGVASVAMFKELGVDVFDKKVEVRDCEWEQEWGWEDPRMMKPLYERRKRGEEKKEEEKPDSGIAFRF